MITFSDYEQKLKDIVAKAKNIIEDVKSLKIERITEETENLMKKLEFQVKDDREFKKYLCIPEE